MRQQDLARASGDERAQIQGELDAHEAAMRKYDAESHGDGQIAVLSAARYGTLAVRLRAWNNQRSRNQLIAQARDQALADVRRAHRRAQRARSAGRRKRGANAPPRTAAPGWPASATAARCANSSASTTTASRPSSNSAPSMESGLRRFSCNIASYCTSFCSRPRWSFSS